MSTFHGSLADSGDPVEFTAGALEDDHGQESSANALAEHRAASPTGVVRWPWSAVDRRPGTYPDHVFCDFLCGYKVQPDELAKCHSSQDYGSHDLHSTRNRRTSQPYERGGSLH